MDIRKTHYTSSCYLTLTMLYLVSILATFIFIKKEIILPFLGVLSVSVFILPISFCCIDIITEVYGYYQAKKTVYVSVVAQGFFVLTCVIAASTPGGFTESNFANPKIYSIIVEPLPKVYIACLISLVAAALINSYLLARSKLILKGKFFWLRSLLTSWFGEAIYTIVGVSFFCIGRFSLLMTIHFIFISYFVNVVSTFILISPTAIIISLIRHFDFEASVSYEADVEKPI